MRALAAPLAIVKRNRGGAMAERKQDLLGRLADLSEEAIQKLSEAPGAEQGDPA